jgi:hypothetical protein
MELNALFTSLVAGAIFLIGFLLAGVLSDYKESEKLPGELVASLKTLSDEMVLRIDTIRDTNFIGSAYAIVEVMGLVITMGLIVMRIEPFYAALFMTVFVAYLIIYMLFLIRDLDNPFDYAVQGERGTEVSLKPLHDLKAEIDR